MGRILVAGELNADLVMSGLPSLPVLGRELVGNDFRIVMGSSSAITAARLAALGAEVDFAGLAGDDDIGRFVLGELAGFGVGTSHVRLISETPTGVTIILTYSSDRAMMTYPGTTTVTDGASLTPDLLGQYQHLHVGSFFLQTSLQPRLARIFASAHELGLTTSLDVGWDPYEDWSRNRYLGPVLVETDYFLPNEVETQALLNGEDQPEMLAERVFGTLLVKQGGKGAAAYDARGKLAAVPTLPVEVVDTTGAGDAFNAGFLYATCIEKRNLEYALRFGTACGAQAVTQVGGATNAPSASEVHKMIER